MHTNDKIRAVLDNKGRFTSISFVTKKGKVRRLTLQTFGPSRAKATTGFHYVCGHDAHDGIWKNVNLDTVLEVRQNGLVHTFRRLPARSEVKIDRRQLTT